jgi:hypothetical protein
LTISRRLAPFAQWPSSGVWNSLNTLSGVQYGSTNCPYSLVNQHRLLLMMMTMTMMTMTMTMMKMTMMTMMTMPRVGRS